MPHITTVRALHGDVVTFDGMPSGYTVPPHLKAIFRDALATRREVSFTTTTRAILTAELLPPPPSRYGQLAARVWARISRH